MGLTHESCSKLLHSRTSTTSTITWPVLRESLSGARDVRGLFLRLAMAIDVQNTPRAASLSNDDPALDAAKIGVAAETALVVARRTWTPKHRRYVACVAADDSNAETMVHVLSSVEHQVLEEEDGSTSNRGGVKITRGLSATRARRRDCLTNCR